MGARETVKVFKFLPIGSRNPCIKNFCYARAQFLKMPFLNISGELYFYYLRSILAIK